MKHTITMKKLIDQFNETRDYKQRELINSKIGNMCGPQLFKLKIGSPRESYYWKIFDRTCKIMRPIYYTDENWETISISDLQYNGYNSATKKV